MPPYTIELLRFVDLVFLYPRVPRALYPTSYTDSRQ